MGRVYQGVLRQFRKTLAETTNCKRLPPVFFDKYVFWVENGGLVSESENDRRIEKAQEEKDKEEKKKPLIRDTKKIKNLEATIEL